MHLIKEGMSTLARYPNSAPVWVYLPGQSIPSPKIHRPRLPDIPRAAHSEPMSLAYELPRHVSQDTVYPYRDAAAATVRNIHCRDAGTDKPILMASAEICLKKNNDITLRTYELR